MAKNFKTISMNSKVTEEIKFKKRMNSLSSVSFHLKGEQTKAFVIKYSKYSLF